MKKIITILLAIYTCSACSDHIIYETVDPSVYLTTSGLVDLTEQFEESSEYTVWAYKSGNSTQEVDIQFGVEEAGLVSYNKNNNTKYTILPDGCYKISKVSDTMSGDNYQSNFPVELAADAIKSLPTGDYVLPLGVRSTKATINTDNNIVLLFFRISKPN